MQRPAIDRLRDEILEGKLNRRDVLKRSVALGLSAPIIAGLLAACGDDDDDTDTDTDTDTDSGQGEPTATTAAEEEPTEAESDEGEPTEAESEGEPTEAGAEEEPTEAEDGGGESAGQRGGGGKITLLYWQAPVILNQHLASGTKDYHATRVALEPLIEFDSDLNPIMVLATEFPSIENGLLAEDGTWVTWKLREGVKWHDGEDFNAEDVYFTWEYVTNEATTATTLGTYINIESAEIVDDYTITFTFKGPDPYWYQAFYGSSALVIPEHIFRDYVGEAARDAPANLMPIGTGPYRVVDFKPGDVVLYELFEDYWEPGKPFFDEVEIKGGGDAASAARAVLQTGEADWAWNLQLEPVVLDQLAAEGQGEVVSIPGGGTERLMIQFADPYTEVDGAFCEPGTEHPLFKDVRIRKALDLACPRDIIAEQLYGAGGIATAWGFDEPAKYTNPDITWEFDLEAAQALLDEAGFPDNFETTRLLYQTSTNTVRQKHQEILKQNFEQLGFSVELKSVDAAIYFSSDAGNPDTAGHFYADLEMHTNGPGPYPVTWAERYRSDDLAQKSNNWAGSNAFRYVNPEYDKLHDQMRIELDEETQIEVFGQMWQIIKDDVVEIPQVARNSVAAMHNRIGNSTPSVWASTPVYDLKNWTLNE
jgi:peptide/nickel transport system substrate-binding protein